VAVIYNAVLRLITPAEINYDGMVLFGIIGVCVNFGAAFLTRESGSLNQRAVNLHMLEDVLGWIVVLIGALVMKFTNFSMIDPLMSIGVAIFILINAVINLKEVLDIFLEKTPSHIDIEEIAEHLGHIEGILSVHHIHVWSMDGQSNYATMHIVARGDHHTIKKHVREELKEHGIGHVTLELETEDECCCEEHCHMDFHSLERHHHHHHHHH
jgi:cobalt-zinc-cadmium efflux system protein